MPKKNVWVVPIPKENIVTEFGWFFERWGEDAVKTYIVKNSQIVDEDLILVGVGELHHPTLPLKKRQRQRLDLLFRKGRVYYAVEAKSTRRYAFSQLLEEVACFEHDMKKHNEPYEKVIPVLVIVDDRIKKSEPYWAEYEYENK